MILALALATILSTRSVGHTDLLNLRGGGEDAVVPRPAVVGLHACTGGGEGRGNKRKVYLEEEERK